MALNDNLFNIMNGYDSSEPLSAGYSNAHLGRIAKSLNSQNGQESEQASARTPQKVKSLIKLIKKIVGGLNAKLASKYPEMKPFSVENSVTYNALGATGRVELIEAGNTQHLSFNIKKLTRLSSMEVTAIITKSVVDAIAKQNGKENDNDFVEELLNADQKDVAEDKKKAKESKDVELAKKIIAGYLRKYLPAVYADDFKKFDNISSYVAGMIVDEMGESDISKILTPFFDLDTLDISSIAIEKVDAFLGKTHQARYLKLTQKAEELAEDPEKGILAIGYEQQAQALLGTDTSDPSYYNLAKKFESLNSGEKVLTGPAVQEFCEYYVHNFLHAHNVKDIEVTFEQRGALGSYFDYGTSQRININLQKLKKMGSYTELAMTLSHELTHAVDSSKNKFEGKANEEDGTGLLDNIDEDISGSGATGEALKTLKELKNLCYYINPNERHARIGELSALIFMQKVGSNDPKIQSEIQSSVSRYINYQQRTINAIQSLPAKLSEIKVTVEQLVSSGELSKSSRAYNLILERIDYLQQHGLGMSVEEEIKSQDVARRIMEGKQIQLEENKRQAEEAERQAQIEEFERQL